MIDKAQAAAEIARIFAQYRKLTPRDNNIVHALNDGKLYELYVLSQLLTELRGRGFTISFTGNDLKFKGGPGTVKVTDPHFTLSVNSRDVAVIFVDIEVKTLGCDQAAVSDLSQQHELDIVVLTSDTSVKHPTYLDVALAIECKCVAKFQKSLLKEALGVKREISFFSKPSQTILNAFTGSSSTVNSNPASEFWLAYIDQHGDNYKQSPGVYGLELRHYEP